jgi:transposase-like protein
MTITDKQKQEIIDAYKQGKRILDIEQEYGLARAALYNILHQGGALPNRANRGEKLRGNTEQLAALYDILNRQEKWCQMLEAKLKEHGIDLPEKVET